MKVLVTGATGFLGQEIVTLFEEKNVEVIGVSKTSRQFPVDITNENNFDALKTLADVGVIIHTAGLAHQFKRTSQNEFFRVNVIGTNNVLKLAKLLKTQHFVLISSVSVYGKTLDKITDFQFQEDLGCNPNGAYATSKFEAEQVAIAFCTENNINLTILRPATIIGESDKGNVARLIKQIRAKRFIWIGKGGNLKSLVSKNDVANLCYLLATKNSSDFRIYNVTSAPIKMSEIVETISDELNVKLPKLYVPTSIAMLLGKVSVTIRKWLADDVFSNKKLFTELGIGMQDDIRDVLRREVRSIES
jgi:nucleoside-diphosphate-sugar epimerase